MAERKPGPVKPPVIDGTARQAASEKPLVAKPVVADKPTVKPAEPIDTPNPKATVNETQPPKVELPVTPRRAPSPWPAAGAGAAGGAIIGVALVYGLASAGLWPTGRQPVDEARLQRLEQTIAATNRTAQTAITDIAAVNSRGEADKASLATLSAALDDLQNGDASAATGLEASLKTLSDRIDAIGAGASSADAGALAENLSRLQTSLDQANVRITALGERVEQSGGAVQMLTSDLKTIKTALAAEAEKPSPQTAMAPALRLPLVLSGLEAAFSSGRPFTAELAGLRQILPDTAIPEPIAGAAQGGIADPRAIAERFNATLPDILAARPVAPNAAWNEAAFEWLRNLLVLRPSGNVAGDSPDAVLARLETAVAAADFAAATPLFEALPEPMRLAAGTLPADIAALAAADIFIASLRTNALAGMEIAQ